MSMFHHIQKVDVFVQEWFFVRISVDIKPRCSGTSFTERKNDPPHKLSWTDDIYHIKQIFLHTSGGANPFDNFDQSMMSRLCIY